MPLTNPATTTYKVGDTVRSDRDSFRSILPEGTILIHAATGTAHTVASWGNRGGVFKDTSLPLSTSSEFRVAWIPAPPTKAADPVGDLAVKLAGKRFGTPDDCEAFRTDSGWRRLAEFVSKNFIPTGQQIVIDDDSEVWYKGADGKYRMDRTSTAFGSSRYDLEDTYGVAHAVTVR